MPSPIEGAGGGRLTPSVSPPLFGPGEMLPGPGQVGPGYGPTIWPGGTPAVTPLVLPKILSPGIGPNGPGPIDMRRMIASVGEQSTVPYGVTNGYAASANWVTGFIGPAAGSLKPPISWYVRKTGANTNGGTDTSTSPARTGSDGSTTNLVATFTSASGAFTTADVGRGLRVGIGAQLRYWKIVSIVSSTQVAIDRPANTTIGSQTWAIGGAWADILPSIGNSGGDTNSPVMSGDTIYIGGGLYQGSSPNAGSNWRPAWNGVVSIIGDVTGAFTGDAGEVAFTPFVTLKTTVGIGTSAFQIGGNVGTSNLSFAKINFYGNPGQFNGCFAIGGTNTQNIYIADCGFVQIGTANSGGPIFVSTNMLNLQIDRCLFWTTNYYCLFVQPGTPANGVGKDYDLNITIRNSRMIGVVQGGGGMIAVAAGLANAKPGGIRVYNCSFFGASTSIYFGNATNWSTVFPSYAYNNLFAAQGGTVAIQAQTLGQIIEDYNLFLGAARTNVAIGPNSQSSYAPLIHFGQELFYGGQLRPFGEPMAGSPLLGFGNTGSRTNYDIYNRPRPAGGGSALPAVGAFERSNTAAQAQSPVPPSGTNDWQFTGPGYQDFLLPVSAAAAGFSISVQRDASYASYPNAPQNAPSVLLLANPTIGVTAQTVVDTGPAAQWNTLTLATFTPTATGWVTIRIASFDGSGVSVVSFAVATPS